MDLNNPNGNSSQPKPFGRPTEYKPEYCQQLIDHMKTGLSYETFAPAIGVSRAVLYNWEKMFPDFLDAKKKAFDENQLFWESAGLTGMTADKFNSTVWVFNMKNRFKWHDQIKIEADVTTEDVKDKRINETLALLQSEFKK